MLKITTYLRLPKQHASPIASFDMAITNAAIWCGNFCLALGQKKRVARKLPVNAIDVFVIEGDRHRDCRLPLNRSQ